MTIAPIDPTTEPITVPTVNVGAFLRGLKSVRPFMGTDWTIPLLTQVQLVAEGNTLTLITTDRYTAGTYRILYGGGDFTACVPAVGVKMLVDVLTPIVKATKYGDQEITFTVTDTTLTVHQYGRPVVSVELGDPDFPKIRQLIPDQSASVERIGVNPAYLARFAKVESDAGKSAPMRMTFTGPLKPIRVDIGEEFTGLIMPVRVGGES